MGTRHQFYIIAKVGGRYRCLAARHHQFLYRADVLEVCLKLIEIFQCPQNRLALSHEVRWALRYEDWDAAKGDETWEAVPFPFTLTCLTIGASFFPEQCYFHNVRWVGFNADFEKCDNNSGITVLDITNPSDIRYCFVDFPSPYTRITENATVFMTPLAAREYIKWQVGGHQDADKDLDNEISDAEKTLIQKLDKCGLIEVSTLNSVWPRSSWKGNIQKDLETNSEASSVSTRRTAHIERALDKAFSSSVEKLPPIIERATSEFWVSVKSKWYTEPATVSKSEASCSLLAIALENDDTIDLSPFELSKPQIRLILSGKSSAALTTLSLSGNEAIDENLLRHILATYPNIRSLHLLNTPQIPLKVKTDLVAGTMVSELLDSELLALPLNQHEALEDTPLTFINPLVHQMVLMSWDGRGRVDEVHLPNGGLDAEKLRTKYGSSYNVLPLVNVNREPIAFLWGLLKFLEYFSGSLIRYQLLRVSENAVGRTLATCLAAATDVSLDVAGPRKIRPLCDQLYRPVKESEEKYWVSSRMPNPIRPNEWTLVLMYESGKKRYEGRVRYAFVTSRPTQEHMKDEASPNILIAGMQTFLQHAIPGEGADAIDKRRPLWESWERLMSIHGYKLCGEGEIQSFIGTISSHNSSNSGCGEGEVKGEETGSGSVVEGTGRKQKQ